MTVKLRKMQAEDIYRIEKRPQTSTLEAAVPPTQAVHLENLPYSRTVVDHEGRIIAIGGVMERWPGNAACWAVFAPGARKYMPAITALTREVLDTVEINRIEIAVRCDFPQGHEWAHELGFKAEAECLRAYDADGHDCSIYARVKAVR